MNNKNKTTAGEFPTKWEREREREICNLRMPEKRLNSTAREFINCEQSARARKSYNFKAIDGDFRNSTGECGTEFEESETQGNVVWVEYST